MNILTGTLTAILSKLENNQICSIPNEDSTVRALVLESDLPVHLNLNPDVTKQNIIRRNVEKEIPKGVLRKKLAKMRHLVIEKGIEPSYLDSLFPQILELFDPQTVDYNGGIAKVKKWKISCYLEVMDGGIPCTNPNIELLNACKPLLENCNFLFKLWYKQQHACNGKRIDIIDVERVMTFITRYTPAPGEEALLKHVDGAGKVDGSIVVALPIDRWSGPEEENSFEGHGGGLTFWDGKRDGRPIESDYDTRSGDVAFIDRAVWHQGENSCVFRCNDYLYGCLLIQNVVPGRMHSLINLMRNHICFPVDKRTQYQKALDGLWLSFIN